MALFNLSLIFIKIKLKFEKYFIGGFHMNRPLKRWNILDTINATLLIVVILYFIDFKNNATVSWIFVIVFAFWAITLIARNVMITRMKNDPNHPMHNQDKTQE